MKQDLHFINGKFKIMQIADTQEVYHVNPDTVKLIKLAIEREKPNLVIFTGDQIKGYSSSFKSDTKRKISETISTLLKPIQEMNIPFTATFGNHDCDCGIPNSEQFEIYKGCPLFVEGERRSNDDKGTFCLEIKDGDNKNSVFALYVFDSNTKEKDGSYSPVFKPQVDWYKAKRDSFKTKNNRYMPALVFQHIPVPEIFKAIKRVKKHTKGAVEAFYSHKNEFYVLDEETLAVGGFMYESPAAPDKNEGEFEAFKEKGDILGVYFGHDHINSFVKKVDGIDLGYTQGAGFNVYGPGEKRGVRIFELSENNLTDYKTYTVTMGELCDFKPSKPVMEYIFTHMPSSIKQVEKAAIKTAIVGGALVAVRIATKLIKKNSKKS